MSENGESESGRVFTGGAVTVNIAQPKYGETITLGTLNGESLTVSRPLNKAAEVQMVNEYGAATLIAIALHDRLEAIEKQLHDKG